MLAALPNATRGNTPKSPARAMSSPFVAMIRRDREEERVDKAGHCHRKCDLWQYDQESCEGFVKGLRRYT